MKDYIVDAVVYGVILAALMVAVYFLTTSAPPQPVVEHFDDLRIIESLEESRRLEAERAQRAIRSEIQQMYLPAYLAGC